MERNRRRNHHPYSSSYESQDGCGTELIQTDSVSSAISLDTCRDISRHCAAPSPVTLLILVLFFSFFCAPRSFFSFMPLEGLLQLDDLTRWTDLQHNSYLNSLEASFVNEMYHSMHLRGCQIVQNNFNEVDKSRTSQKPCNMSKKFLIPQDGFWKKVSHERNEPMLESSGDSHVLAGSPLKFTSVERGCAMRNFAVHHGGLLCDKGHRRGKSIFSGRSPRSSAEQHDPCYPESAAITPVLVEATDQNFKDEDQGAPSSCVPMDKRLKTASADDASRCDHVVPIEKFYSTELSSSGHSSSENKRQDELLSELPDSFHLPKPICITF